MQWLRIAQCDGYIRIGASLPENRKRKKSLVCVFKELDYDGEGGMEREREKRKKEREKGRKREKGERERLSVHFSCPKMQVMNYHSVLLNVLQESRSHMMI